MLKTAGSWTTRERIQQTTDLLAFLQSRGVTWAPGIRPAVDGAFFCEHDGQFSYLMEWIDGAGISESPENYGRFGALLAEMSAMTGIPGTHEDSFEDRRQEMLEAGAQYPFQAEYASLVKGLPRMDDLALPLALSHPDFHLGQVLQRPDGSWVIVDWDDAGIGWRLAALAYPLTLCFVCDDLTILRPEGTAFYAAYAERSEISDLERKYLFDVALIPALYFLQHTPNRALAWKKIQFAVSNREPLLSLLPPPR